MKIVIIGAFDFKGMDTGGQPVKSRALYHALKRKYGDNSVSVIETFNWKQKPIRIFAELVRKLKGCDIAIMLPAHNGVNIFSRLLLLFKDRNTKIFYDVVGGWLPTKLKDEKGLKRSLLRFDGIWVETSSMLIELEKMGFKNVNVIPNFKNIKILNSSDLHYCLIPPYKVCTFSRVIPEKGIEDAINIVKKVNDESGKVLFFLDIYGPVPDSYKERFENILFANSNYVSYKGVVEPENSVDVIKQYYALLFPTRFYTEGVPGTIIDSYSAGVPVITSVWVNASDVFEDGVTGYGYQFGDIEEFGKIMRQVGQGILSMNALKKNCLSWALKYSEESIIEVISSIIN